MANDIIIHDDADKEGWVQATRSILAEQEQQQESEELTKQVTQTRDDFNTARENILDLINDASVAVKSVGQLADQAQTWQYYNVLNGAIKTAVEANEKLMQLHEIRKKLGEPAGPKTVKQQLIMTSSALLEMLQEGEKE